MVINMAVEIVRNQLRIRLIDPEHFNKFRTGDAGTKGRLQLIIGLLKPPYKGKWKIQSIRMNLMDYKNVHDAIKELNNLDMVDTKYFKAHELITNWFNKR